MRLGHLGWILVVIGVATAISGIAVRARRDPTSVEWEGRSWRIERWEEGEAVHLDFVRTGTGGADLSLAGSTDTACDAPWLALFDVDGNGQQDVYFHHCRGHGFVKYESGLVFVDLGQSDPDDAPSLRSAFFLEIQAGGVRLIAAGVLLCAAGAGSVLGAWCARRRRRRDGATSVESGSS